MGPMDLNADLGEGYAHDEQMLALITSANVACGGHAGDDVSMDRLCAQAAARDVRIGAHVSYVDRDGFGRRSLRLPNVELRDHLLAQIAALTGHAARHATSVRYLKPHGALYHDATTDPGRARVVVEVAAEWSLTVVGAPDSLLLREASAAGLSAVPEGFADRGYRRDGALIPRGHPGAVMTEERQVADRVRQLLRTGTVTAADGVSVHLPVRTLCLHSDTPGAVRLAQTISDQFTAAGLSPQAFA